MELFFTPKSGIQTKPALEVKFIQDKLFCLYLSFWVGKRVCIYTNPLHSHHIMELFCSVPPSRYLFQELPAGKDTLCKSYDVSRLARIQMDSTTFQPSVTLTPPPERITFNDPTTTTTTFSGTVAPFLSVTLCPGSNRLNGPRSPAAWDDLRHLHQPARRRDPESSDSCPTSPSRPPPEPSSTPKSPAQHHPVPRRPTRSGPATHLASCPRPRSPDPQPFLRRRRETLSAAGPRLRRPRVPLTRPRLGLSARPPSTAPWPSRADAEE
nr:lysine-rich arabinogalactan protein 19-like [Equus asinus]XP_044604706.1 lysine-rich arabinogalactan protein 19-like [Equus asinus]XP_044604754.1 lysine-rich arabinogalactan protein 19-like [Equus asinus]